MKDSTKKIQTKRTFEAFREQPRTMLEVAKLTGILRANVCRYVAHFRKHGKIVEVKEGPCPISKHKAGFYSTDPQYFPAETELDLFPKQPTKSRAYAL
jgi:hypothetical protein